MENETLFTGNMIAAANYHSHALHRPLDFVAGLFLLQSVLIDFLIEYPTIGPDGIQLNLKLQEYFDECGLWFWLVNSRNDGWDMSSARGHGLPSRIFHFLIYSDHLRFGDGGFLNGFITAKARLLPPGYDMWADDDFQIGMNSTKRYGFTRRLRSGRLECFITVPICSDQNSRHTRYHLLSHLGTNQGQKLGQMTARSMNQYFVAKNARVTLFQRGCPLLAFVHEYPKMCLIQFLNWIRVSIRSRTSALHGAQFEVNVPCLSSTGAEGFSIMTQGQSFASDMIIQHHFQQLVTILSQAQTSMPLSDIIETYGLIVEISFQSNLIA